jgi:hypothetical protein
MLGSKEGRAFLADPNVDPTSRTWAASQVAADPAGAAKMIAGQDKPWETSAVAQAFARPRWTAWPPPAATKRPC